MESPFNKLPLVVVGLALVIAGIEIALQMAHAGLIGGARGVGWREVAFEDYGVFNSVWEQLVSRRYFPWEHMRRFLTYPLFHAGFQHAIFVVVFILAMGNFVGRVFHPLAVLAIFWLASITGALAFVVVFDYQYVFIGGFPGAYGLIGAFTFLLWVDLAGRAENQMRAFTLIAILMGIQVLFGFIRFDFGNVLAELVGFATGFFASFLLAPGGWSRAIAKLRQR